MAGRLGAQVDLAKLPVDPAAAPLTAGAKLFSESQSRFIVTVTPPNLPAFEALFAGLPAARIGEVTSGPDLVVRDTGFLFSAGLDEMFARWRRPLDW
jgi:phosphoribosylformylglycinamidine synthase